MAEGLAGIDRVFVNPDGSSMYRSAFQRCDYKPLLKQAGHLAVRFQDLSHTSALLLAATVHPKIVQERLGHSQLGTTMDTYSHVMSGTGRDAADRLGEMPGTPVPKAAGA